jgi:hypothetical protein
MFSLMSRRRAVSALAGVIASAGTLTTVSAAPAGAAPPAPPPGCSVVVTTPAGNTGAPPAQANKNATFARLCGP